MSSKNDLAIGIAISSLRVENNETREPKKINNDRVPNWLGSYARVSNGVPIPKMKYAPQFFKSRPLANRKSKNFTVNLLNIIIIKPGVVQNADPS